MSKHSDVLVVGAGIIGLTAAWRAACRGLSVTVLDPTPRDGASMAAAGMLAAVCEADFGEPELAAMNVDSAARWPDFAAELEKASRLDVGLRQTGTLTLAFDPDDLAETRRLIDLQHRWGLVSEEISTAQARRISPLVGRVAGGAWMPDDHQVDPRATTRALDAAARAAGAVVVECRAVRLTSASGRVVGAVDAAGVDRTADLVVVAAGVSSTGLLATAGIHAPLRPVKGITLRLAAEPWFDVEPVVRARVQGRAVYAVTRVADESGFREVVIGASSDEKPDDRRVEAGSVFALLRDARAVLPGIDELDLREASPRVRPSAPDNLPYLDASVDGLLVATGHGRNGILLTPLTSAVVDATLDETDLPDVVAPAMMNRHTRIRTEEAS
ncbi:glycine oxidase [Paraoerskovia marina]|uniref:glycine oxidase n=1 Tax=Paraoerskovia marina TaxID=545619 RepID=A0A1H1V565_9CELL|nr:glycine oxidase ThiO [Paraoerskovia marina]SDS79409.1 glycine oxidase [Paraoerskovia marina]